MVKEDPDPVERVRWTSTRRSNKDQDDLNTDAKLRGGVPLQSAEEDTPLALEDPWWVKLFGFKSPHKAVMFACFIMGVGLYLIVAGTVQERLTRAVRICEQLDQVDTSLNSIQNWLTLLKVTHFRAPKSRDFQHVDRKLAISCAMQGWSDSCTKKVFAEKQKQYRQDEGGLGPQVSETVTYVGRRGRGRNLNRLYSDELRLPVGVALGYHMHLAQAETKECASGEVFHYICYTFSRRSKKKFEGLKRALKRIILHISSKVQSAPLSGKRVQLLSTLLSEARRAGVMTEISRPDLQEDSAAVLKKVLLQLQRHQEQRSVYKDIMLYPGTLQLLYRGQFLGIKFEGGGSLYHAAAGALQVAYNGEWSKGRMHGYGSLYNQDGALVWEGYFEGGRPVRPFWVL